MALVLSDAEERKRRWHCRLAEREAREKNGERKAREKNDERKARETTAERKAREEAWEKARGVPFLFRSAFFDRYEKACAIDPEVGNFDKVLRARTSGVIQGVGSHGFSVDSINFANHALLETEKTFKKIISESSVEISKNPSATELSDLYLGISGKNKELLSKAKDLLEINLEEWGLADKFLPALECLRIRQSEMLETFIRLRAKLDKKLENVQSWSTLSNVLFGATAASLLTGSVMAAAFEAPLVAASFAASYTFGSAAGTWLYSSLKKYEETIKGQRVLVDSLCENTRGLLKDLDNIRILLGGSSYEVVIDIGEEEGFTDEMGILDSKHTGSCSRDTPYAPDHDQVIPKEVPLVCA